jgi:high-affinity Fe2+/Pb2+ permease
MKELKRAFNSTLDIIVGLAFGIILGSVITMLSIKLNCEKENQFTFFKTTFECNKK